MHLAPHSTGESFEKQVSCGVSRARIDYCRVKYHIYKMALSNSAACNCGFSRQTAAHFVYHCAIHRRTIPIGDWLGLQHFFHVTGLGKNYKHNSNYAINAEKKYQVI